MADVTRSGDKSPKRSRDELLIENPFNILILIFIITIFTIILIFIITIFTIIIFLIIMIISMETTAEG
ncbi:unnamed protein product [Pleuronectes platessa]|uniref:Uncharacterized protein n=1 Tax=Pleuronectes platessa TaxID=8262 RepID=A0A9N7U2W7_PLEPL|nr:unnamed protein product [Pleuronectes platessa]